MTIWRQDAMAKTWPFLIIAGYSFPIVQYSSVFVTEAYCLKAWDAKGQHVRKSKKRVCV